MTALTGAYLKQYCPPVQRPRPRRPQSADGSSGHLEPEYCHPEPKGFDNGRTLYHNLRIKLTLKKIGVIQKRRQV